jgi:hypothetical protein
VSEGDTAIVASSETAAASERPKKPRKPRSPGTRLLLSQLPLVIVIVAYGYDFLLRQIPEFSGVAVMGQIGTQASVLVWATLPGTGTGASGTDGVLILLAIIGSIVLAAAGRSPAAFVPAAPRSFGDTVSGGPVSGSTASGSTAGDAAGDVPEWRQAFRKTPPMTVLAVPAVLLVVIGLVFRVFSVLGQAWQPEPLGGLAFGLLGAIAALFALREILLTPVLDGPAAKSDRESGAGDSGGRGTKWFVLVAITWIGDVAIGRYFQPDLVTAIRAVAPAKRWAYLGDHSSWWLYLLGLIVVIIAYAIVQLLPPWGSRAKRIVTAAIILIAGLVAFQETHPYVQHAVTHLLQHPPRG